MRVRIFGFGFDQSLLPKITPVETLFDYIRRQPTVNSEETLRSAAKHVSISHPINGSKNKWWLGIILKVRDAAEFTKASKMPGGHVRITSDVLQMDDRLVEANCFLINPDSA